MSSTYRCPTDSEPVLIGSPGFITGCGRTFTAEPDFEDLVDCPHCGIWFESAQGAESPAGFSGGAVGGRSGDDNKRSGP